MFVDLDRTFRKTGSGSFSYQNTRLKVQMGSHPKPHLLIDAVNSSLHYSTYVLRSIYFHQLRIPYISVILDC